MKNIDPGSLFAFFAILMFAGVFNAPFLIFMFVIFMVIRSASGNQRDQRRQSNRNRNTRQSTRRNQRDYRRQAPTPERRRREADYTRQEKPQYKRRTAPARPKNNPFKESGLAKYRDYDYEGAIEDYNKALQINANDIAVHFNLACAYSLTEETEKSYHHLSTAVKLGFSDFEKIKTHDALAFIRIQDEFEPFVQNNYKWPLTQQAPKAEGNILENTDLLEQLNKLGELRDKGLLTEEEFVLQKKKLLG